MQSTDCVPIAFVITDLDRGGAELAMVQVISRLDRARWQPVVYCLTHRGKLADELEDICVPVTCYGLRPWNLPFVLWRLRSALKDTKPLVVQTILYHANILGRVAAWLAGAGHVVSGIRVAEKRSWFRLFLDRWTDRFVTKHVCVSKAVARFSAEQGGLPKEKLVVVPNGVDVDRFRHANPASLEEFGVPDDAFVVLSVGRLEPQKNPMVLLEGVSPLCPRFANLHVLFVGAGSLESSLRERCKALKCSDRVHFAGRQENVPGIMRASDCLVLTSLWEGMPNVVLEAMAAGLPVIATEVEGVRELIPDEAPQKGFVIPQDLATDLIGDLIPVLIERGSNAGITEPAQAYVAEHFTWDATAAGFEAVYNGLLAR